MRPDVLSGAADGQRSTLFRRSRTCDYASDPADSARFDSALIVTETEAKSRGWKVEDEVDSQAWIARKAGRIAGLAPGSEWWAAHPTVTWLGGAWGPLHATELAHRGIGAGSRSRSRLAQRSTGLNEAKTDPRPCLGALGGSAASLPVNLLLANPRALDSSASREDQEPHTQQCRCSGFWYGERGDHDVVKGGAAGARDPKVRDPLEAGDHGGDHWARVCGSIGPEFAHHRVNGSVINRVGSEVGLDLGQ